MMGKDRQSVTFRLKVCTSLSSQAPPHRRYNTEHRHNKSLFHQKGQAVGQCSIQAPDQTCSIHMQEQLHRLGQGEGQGWGPGTIGRPQHPYQDAWALGSAASTRTRRQTTGRLPHCWNPIPLARKKDGTQGTESGQSTALDLYRVGTALPIEGPSPIPRTAQP